MKVRIISTRVAFIFGLLLLVITWEACKPGDNDRAVDWANVELSINQTEQMSNVLASTSGTILTTAIFVVNEEPSVTTTSYIAANVAKGLLTGSSIELTLPLNTPLWVVQVNFLEEVPLSEIETGTKQAFSVGTSTVFTVAGAGEVEISIAFGPHVVSISPAEEATGIALTTSGITVTFNEAMDPDTITVNSTNTECTGSVQLSADNFTTCVRLSADITASANNTAFTFLLASGLSANATYKIRITQTATDANGNAFSSVFTMESGFSTIVGYNIGGTVRGLLNGTSLVLQNLGGDDLTISSNGSFAFSTRLLSNLPYGVTIATPPTMGNCFLNNNSGTVATSDVTTVSIICLMGGAVQGAAFEPATSADTLVSTFAGTGSVGSDDGPAASATFQEQTSITTNGTSLFVADQANHAIREIDLSTNMVSTVVDTGLFNPWGITTDGINLYVADTSNHIIRQIVIADGAVTTLAGSSQGSNDGTGTGAQFDTPQGITTDGINLYVADSTNNKIRRIVISSKVVTTLAGNGAAASADNTVGTSASFDYPTGITTDGISLFVADWNNHEIRRIELSGNNAVTTLAGNDASSDYIDDTGPAARFNYPSGISTNGIDLFVTDRSNARIRRIVISTGVVTTIAGTGGTATFDNGAGNVATFYLPDGIVVNDTILYVSDGQHNAIRKIEIPE